ncbi:metallophosphoesterase family protein [Alteromonas sp. CYL-A6]|uniref:metallophosphoesterase family protein n=1 Tax=Alteromonas nitratireducens TaxID=3390813 RepID=UPI0034B508FA
MRLIQLSDCHLFSAPDKAGYNGIRPYHSLDRVLAQLAGEAPDAVLVTGDISGDDSAASYAHFLALMKRHLSCCDWRVLPGNHDHNPHATQLAAYELRAGQPWQLDKWLIHGLDTRTPATAGWVNQTELTATSDAIASYPEHAHLLALHHHILPADSWMDSHPLSNAADVLAWLDAHPCVKTVIHGHVHYPLIRTQGDCQILGVPSTCWQFAMTPSFEVDSAPPGYRILTLHNDGHIESEIRRVD